MSKDVISLMKTKLIEARTKEEQKIEDFAKAISSINIEEVFGDVYVPPVMTLETFCPEAYKENPDPDIYDKQFKDMFIIFEDMNNKIMEYNSEAVELLNQYKMMS